MSDDEKNDEAVEKIREAIKSLGIEFDTVQVFATRLNAKDDTTTAFECGEGNWYARFGHVKEWVVKQDELARISVRPDEGDEDDD